MVDPDPCHGGRGPGTGRVDRTVECVEGLDRGDSLGLEWWRKGNSGSVSTSTAVGLSQSTPTPSKPPDGQCGSGETLS